MEELLNILRQEVELHEQLITMLEIEFEGSCPCLAAV